MSMKSIIPSAPEIGREALIVIGGAVLAAVIMSQVPSLQNWIKSMWNGTPHPLDPGG